MNISYGEIISRLLLATAIGIIFGFERKRSNKPVGIRTHVLIALASGSDHILIWAGSAISSLSA